MAYTNFDTNGNPVKSDVIAFTPKQVVATGVEDIIIKRSAGVVAFVHCASDGVGVALKDGDQQVWPTLIGVDEDDFSQCPLQFGSSIVLGFSGAGVAYIAYR